MGVGWCEHARAVPLTRISSTMMEREGMVNPNSRLYLSVECFVWEEGSGWTKRWEREGREWVDKEMGKRGEGVGGQRDGKEGEGVGG